MSGHVRSDSNNSLGRFSNFSEDELKSPLSSAASIRDDNRKARATTTALGAGNVNSLTKSLFENSEYPCIFVQGIDVYVHFECNNIWVCYFSLY